MLFDNYFAINNGFFSSTEMEINLAVFWRGLGLDLFIYILLGSSLWGKQHVSTLKYSAMTILPVFLEALKQGHPLVIYEIALQMESLVVLQGILLNAPGWEEAVTVLDNIVANLGLCDASLKPIVENHLQVK